MPAITYVNRKGSCYIWQYRQVCCLVLSSQCLRSHHSYLRKDGYEIIGTAIARRSRFFLDIWKKNKKQTSIVLSHGKLYTTEEKIGGIIFYLGWFIFKTCITHIWGPFTKQYEQRLSGKIPIRVDTTKWNSVNRALAELSQNTRLELYIKC